MNGCAWCETPAEDKKTLPITGVPANDDDVKQGRSWFCPTCKIPYATLRGSNAKGEPTEIL